MFCGKCGNNLPDDALFCPRCGEKVKSTMYPESEINGAKSGKTEAALIRRPRVLIGLIAGLAALTVVILMLVLTRGGGLRLFKSAEPYNHETSNFRTAIYGLYLDQPVECGSIAYYDGYTYYVEYIYDTTSTGEWKGTRILRVEDKGTEPETVIEREGETLCYLTFFDGKLYALGNDGSAGWSYREFAFQSGDMEHAAKNYSVYLIDPEKGTAELQAQIDGVGGSGLVSEGENSYYFQTLLPVGTDRQRNELVIFRAEDAGIERYDLGEWRDWRSSDRSESDRAYFPLGVYRERAYYVRFDGKDSMNMSASVVSYDLTGMNEKTVYRHENPFNVLDSNYDVWAFFLDAIPKAGYGMYDYMIGLLKVCFTKDKLFLQGLEIDLVSGNAGEVTERTTTNENTWVGSDGQDVWECSFSIEGFSARLCSGGSLKIIGSDTGVKIPGTVVGGVDTGYGGSWIYVFCSSIDFDWPEGYTKEDVEGDEKLNSQIMDSLNSSRIGFWRIDKETGEADFIPMYEELLEEEKDNEMASESELD